MVNKTILITGASGYLGSRLVEHFVAQGYRIIALLLEKSESYRIHYQTNSLVMCYYLESTSLEKIFSENEIDIIIHTATLYGRKQEQLASMIQANIEFPLEVLTLAIEHNVGLFINTDSILNKNISPYALTKGQFSEWLDMFSDKIKVANLRFDQFYGPNDNPVKFVAWLVEQLKAKVEKIDLTEGLQTRDFIYIDDVISAFDCIVKNEEKLKSGIKNNFEVGTGTKTTVRTFVQTLKRALNNNVTALNFGAIPYRKNEVLDYDIDNSELMRLGWLPKFTVTKGIEKIVEIEGCVK